MQQKNMSYYKPIYDIYSNDSLFLFLDCIGTIDAVFSCNMGTLLFKVSTRLVRESHLKRSLMRSTYQLVDNMQFL